jgi:hypothetical protein
MKTDKYGTKVVQIKPPSEHEEQKTLIAWLDFKKIAYFAVPNEGLRTQRNGARLKAQGMVAGAPDIVLVDLTSAEVPVAIEMKTKKGRLTDSQRNMHDIMRRAGWHVIVAYGAEDAVDQLRKAGFGKTADDY